MLINQILGIGLGRWLIQGRKHEQKLDGRDIVEDREEQV
jgi:hypothetical protein